MHFTNVLQCEHEGTLLLTEKMRLNIHLVLLLTFPSGPISEVRFGNVQCQGHVQYYN